MLTNTRDLLPWIFLRHLEKFYQMIISYCSNIISNVLPLEIQLLIVTKYLYFFFAKKIERLSSTVSCLVACEASYDDDVL